MLLLSFYALLSAPLLVFSFTGKGVKTYHPKPRKEMLKPMTEVGRAHQPTPRTSGLSVFDSDSWFMVETYYAATGYNCNYESTMKLALATLHCFETDPSSSIMYSCSSEYVCYYYEYSDVNCVNQVNSFSMNLGMCLEGDANDDGYVTDGGAGIAFLSQMLTAQRGVPLPLPGNSTTLSYYQSSNCDINSVNYLTRFAYPNLCYNNYNGQNLTSTQYVEPYLVSYNDYGCDPATVDSSEPFPPGQCQSTATLDSYKLVLNFDVVSPAPTMYPTSGPKVDYDAVVGTTLAGFSAMAAINTLLFFFQPPQDTSSESETSTPAAAEKASEF